MKTDIACRWSDETMKSFPHLKNKDFNITVDCDYIEDEDDLIRVIADEVYHNYDVVLETDTAVRNLVVDFYEVENRIFN